MHQKNKTGTKAWYRCTHYEANHCRATAVVHTSSQTLLKVTRNHMHLPGFLKELARLDRPFSNFSYYEAYFYVNLFIKSIFVEYSNFELNYKPYL
jgi:hypothetical protein